MAGAVFTAPAFAGTAGKTGFSFLKISSDARSAAMGETGLNPAGLASLKVPQIAHHSVNHLKDVYYGIFSYGHPYSRGVWGLEAGFLTVNDIPKTRYDPSSMDRFVEVGEVKAGAQSLGFSWAARKGRDLKVGVSSRVVKEDLDTKSVTSFMVDGGVIYRVDPQWRVVAAATNLGTPTHYGNNSFYPPAAFKIGTAVKSRPWAEWSLEGVLFLDATQEARLGLEFDLKEKAFLRLGYRYYFQNKNSDPLSGVTAGVGGWLNCFRVDYGFLFFGDLGTSHRLSLTWRFPPRKT
jgi:hypothetical protein